MSLLHEVAAIGDTDRLEDLLAQSRTDKNEKDEDWGGRTPLCWATIEGHLTCVRLLLQAGANPNIRNNDGKSVAHFSAENGRFDILKTVIEYGCDVTVKDEYGDTAMDYALMYGHLKCADLINKALRGEFNVKVTENSSTPKSFRPELRRRHTVFSSLGVKKNHDNSEFKHSSSKRKRLPGRPNSPNPKF